MKKIIVLLLMGVLSFPACAGQDKPISAGELPEKAREFISEHFEMKDISLATRDKELFDTSYEVFFTNGNKIEFDKKGQWKDIDCKHSRVPDAVIPDKIQEYIKANHPGRHVKEIDRDKRDYELKLDNGLELKFNLKFQLIGYDD